MIERRAAARPEAQAIVCRRALGCGLAGEVEDLLQRDAASLAALYPAGDGSVDPAALAAFLRAGTRRFRLAGVDLLRVNRAPGWVVLETNSCPGFAYCTPADDAWEWAYLRTAQLVVAAARRAGHEAGLALLTESKLPCETVGFQAALGHCLGRPVPVLDPGQLRAARRDLAGWLQVEGRRLSGGLRYLHHRPWEVLPADAPGSFVNGTDVDLAGARDKVAAHRAYQRFNGSRPTGVPELSLPRAWIVESEDELPALGSSGVLKRPHGCSGDGITFFSSSSPLERRPGPFPLLVQELIWPAGSREAGATTQELLADRVYDLRVVVGCGEQGLFPLMLYARLGQQPFNDRLAGRALRQALLTNIAVAEPTGGHRFDYDRLVLPSPQGWETLGLREVDFAAAFVQAALATIAIDRAVGET